MNNNTTELVFILDNSGSMSGLESDTVGGFNSMLKKQKNTPGKCFVSTIFFNSKSEVIHDRIPIENIAPMTNDDYIPSGSTALFDAIGDAIKHIGNIHKYARAEDVPKNTLFVITTDGMENASMHYTQSQIREMIEYRKQKHGWDFIFVAANIDAETTACDFGIPKSNAVNYHADAQGTACLYDNISDIVCGVRCGHSLTKGSLDKLRKDYRR